MCGNPQPISQLTLERESVILPWCLASLTKLSGWRVIYWISFNSIIIINSYISHSRLSGWIPISHSLYPSNEALRNGTFVTFEKRKALCTVSPLPVFITLFSPFYTNKLVVSSILIFLLIPKGTVHPSEDPECNYQHQILLGQISDWPSL